MSLSLHYWHKWLCRHVVYVIVLLVWTWPSSGGTPTSSKHFSQKSSPWFTVCSDLSLHMFYSCKISHYGWELLNNNDCNKRNMDPLDCYQVQQSLPDHWVSTAMFRMWFLPNHCRLCPFPYQSSPWCFSTAADWLDIHGWREVPWK